MTRYLDLADLTHITDRLPGKQPEIRDAGLLIAALARPRAVVHGEDVYPSLALKAAALLSSLATCGGLQSQNLRVAWVATRLFCAANGAPLTAPVQAAAETVRDVGLGQLGLERLAESLGVWLTPNVVP